jgi:hypothetical protein
MSLIDLYIDAVRKYLPRKQRDDIALELREILQTQAEEEETQRGRPLTAEETGAILKRYGHPRDVAGRYGGRQYLIGPAVYPSYVFAVKVVFYVVSPLAAFMLLITVLTTEANLIEKIFETLWSALALVLFNLAITTLAFMRFGRSGAAEEGRQDWDPDELWSSSAGASNPHEPIRRSEAIGALLGMSFLLCWWLGLNGVLWRWFGFSPLPFNWTGVWASVNYVVIPILTASIGREVLALARPRRRRLYVGAGIVLDVLAVGVLLRLLRAGTYVVVDDGSFPFMMLFDKSIFVLLLVMTIGAVINLALSIRTFISFSKPWRKASA